MTVGGTMEKPKFELTGIHTVEVLVDRLRKALKDFPNEEQGKFRKAEWTCRTFDEWLSLGSNWFDFTGEKVVAEGQNRWSCDSH